MFAAFHLVNGSSTRSLSVAGMTSRFAEGNRRLGRGDLADVAWGAVEIGWGMVTRW